MIYITEVVQRLHCSSTKVKVTWIIELAKLKTLLLFDLFEAGPVLCQLTYVTWTFYTFYIPFQHLNQ